MLDMMTFLQWHNELKHLDLEVRVIDDKPQMGFVFNGDFVVNPLIGDNGRICEPNKMYKITVTQAYNICKINGIKADREHLIATAFSEGYVIEDMGQEYGSNFEDLFRWMGPNDEFQDDAPSYSYEDAEEALFQHLMGQF